MGKSELRESIGLASVVLGLMFVGMEMRQNTRMMQAQIRNSITENNMEYLSWQATSEALAEALEVLTEERGLAGLSVQQDNHVAAYAGATLRAFENEHYQNKAGLFTDAEFTARKEFWRVVLTDTPMRVVAWRSLEMYGHTLAPDFRAELLAIMEEARQAQ